MYQSLARYRASQGAAWSLRRSNWAGEIYRAADPRPPELPLAEREPVGEVSRAPADTPDT